MADEDDWVPRGVQARESNPNTINFYFETTTHHIQVGQAHNASFGPNYGTLNQITSQSQGTPTPGSPVVPSVGLQFGISSLVSLLDPIPDASHTRNRKTSPPDSACFPGTRQKVLRKIRLWAGGGLTTDYPHAMWVYGYAGCGKSAIAQEIAEHYASHGRLAASFFFFRGSSDRSGTARFATTVACQVAGAIPSAAPLIEAALAANPGLANTAFTSLTAQFQQLIYGPISSINFSLFDASFGRGPFLIVLDGLDECEDREEIATFIEHMVKFFDETPQTPLRFLITSRVEQHIHQKLHSSKQVKLLNLVDHTSDADIAAALDAAILDAKGGRVLACEDSWPSREDREKLVKHIGGSFIFMVTIVKFLFDARSTDRLTPISRLPLALNINPGFDGLYTTILKSCEHLPHFLDVIKTIGISSRPLSIVQLGAVLAIKPIDIVNVLVNLHAIVQCPGDDHTPIILWHASLYDFLRSEKRSGCFFATPAHHRHLAYRCISYLAKPRIPDAEISDFVQGFGVKHWKKYVRTMRGDRRLLRAELDDIIAHLRAAFPKDFQTLAPVYFRFDPRFMRTFLNNHRQLTLVSLLGHLSPETLRSDSHPWPLFKMIFDPLVGSLSPAEFLEQLCLFQRPLLQDTSSYHLDMVMRGIYLMIGNRAPDEVLVLESGSAKPDYDTEYMFNCWARHLALAIQAYPQHPAFYVPDPLPIAVEGKRGRPAIYFARHDWRHVAIANLEFAEQTIAIVWSEDALDVAMDEWGWDSVGSFAYAKAHQGSVTVFEVLRGIRLLRCCFQSVCIHPKTEEGKCALHANSVQARQSHPLNRGDQRSIFDVME